MRGRALALVAALVASTAAAGAVQVPGLAWGMQAATVATQARSQGYRQQPTAPGGPLTFKAADNTLEAGFTDAGGLDWVRLCYRTNRTAALVQQYTRRFGRPGQMPPMDGPPLYDTAAAFWPANTPKNYHGNALYVGSLGPGCLSALEFHRAW